MNNLSKTYKEIFFAGENTLICQRNEKVFCVYCFKNCLENEPQKSLGKTTFQILKILNHELKKTFESDSTHACNGNDLCRAFTRRYKTVQCTDIRDGYCVGSNFILC